LSARSAVGEADEWQEKHEELSREKDELEGELLVLMCAFSWFLVFVCVVCLLVSFFVFVFCLVVVVVAVARCGLLCFVSVLLEERGGVNMCCLTP